MPLPPEFQACASATGVTSIASLPATRKLTGCPTGGTPRPVHPPGRKLHWPPLSACSTPRPEPVFTETMRPRMASTFRMPPEHPRRVRNCSMRPCSINNALLQNLRTSSFECEASTRMPVRSMNLCSRMLAFSMKAASPVPMPSSSSRISGSMLVEMANDRRVCMPFEYVRIGIDRNGPSSVNATMSATLASICWLVRPRYSPRRRMFSYPEESGSMPKPASNKGAMRPCTVTRPASGV